MPGHPRFKETPRTRLLKILSRNGIKTPAQAAALTQDQFKKMHALNFKAAQELQLYLVDNSLTQPGWLTDTIKKGHL